MFLSKIWVFLLAVAAALAFGVALVVPRPAAREIARSYAENLDRGQHNADLMLRLEARDWIDAVAKMAWDSALVDVLEQASNRKGDIKQHQAKASGRLLSLVNRLKSEFRPQLLIAVDYRGKQIARVGPGDDRYVPGETGLAGYPLVEAALRGYRGDDTWSIDSKLFLMAASPVISRSKGRYVGALLLGHELGDTFARRLKARLGGADVAFFLRGKMVAATVQSADLSKLPLLYTKRRAQIVRDGRSPAIRIGEGDRAHNVILAALPGEAGEHDAFYAAVGAPAPTIGLGEMLSLIRKTDLTWREFPWLLLGGGLLAALVVGLLLPLWEAELPARRLLRGLNRLARREMAKLDDRLYSGKYGSMARLVNEALDKVQAKRPVGRDSGKTPAVNEVALLARDVQLAPISAGVEPLGSLRPPPMAMHELPPPGRNLPPLSPEDLPTELQAQPIFGTEPQFDSLEQVSGPSVPELRVTASRSVTPPGVSAAAAFDLEPLLIPKAPEEIATPSSRRVRIPASEDTALPSAPLADNPPVVLPELAPLPPLPGVGLPPVELQQQPEKPSAEDADEEYFKQVFKEFLAIKRQCGENVANLTYERFAVKLRKNRETLISSYNCKSVKFQVYIKDGKAALKATPVKD
jgi:hypothetical protein